MDVDSEASCALCRRILSSDTEDGDLEVIGVCGDCKFLLLEDFETSSLDMRQTRMPASRRRYSSSESIESMFSQQFSQMIILARQNQSAVLDHDSQSVDGEGVARIVQQSSSRTTPSGSRRFRRALSDNESDGFDSLYGETESNVSFRRYRTSRSEADSISYSAYEGDTDASADDGQSFLENENIGHQNTGSGLESDTDIDPMNAGLYHWNSDDDDVEDDSEWEEADTMANTPESLRSGAAQRHGLLRVNGRNVHISGGRQLMSPEVEGAFSFRTLDRIQVRSDDLLTNFEEFVAGNYDEDSVDDLDTRGFEDLLEHLAEAENSRRGAPPASVSFVNNMPCMTIKEDKRDGVTCAICKESLNVGAVVNQLPCFHLYHPSCILPWLSARNTCPLCRYELPTDDNDYEARKVSWGNGHGTLDMDNHDYHPHDVNDENSLDTTYDASVVGGPSDPVVPADSVGERSGGAGDNGRHRWLLAAAAPIVSIFGISLMLWFHTSSRGCQRSSHIPYRRESSQTQRRWWWLYLFLQRE